MTTPEPLKLLFPFKSNENPWQVVHTPITQPRSDQTEDEWVEKWREIMGSQYDVELVP